MRSAAWRAPQRIVMEDERVRQPYVMRQYLAPTRGSGDPETAAALEVLSQVLGDGITSRFAEKLERGDRTAISTGAWYSATMRDAGSFTIYGVPARGVDLRTVEDGLDAVLARLKEEGPTEEELDRVKRLSRASLIYAQDSQSGLARRYGRALAVGLDLEDIAAWPDAIQAVSAEDVRRVAREYLVPERSVTGWLRRDGSAAQAETEKGQG
jgi:zinc protease